MDISIKKERYMKEVKFNSNDVLSQKQENIQIIKAANVQPQQARETLDKHLLLLHRTAKPVAIQETVADSFHGGVAFKNDINFIPAGADSTCEWKEPLSFLRVELNPQIVKEIADKESLSSSLDLSYYLRNQDHKMQQLLLWLNEEVEHGNPQGKLYIDSVTNLIIYHILKQHNDSQSNFLSKTPGLEHLKIAMEYMQDHYAESITLDELTRLSNLSSSHFINSFKQTLGVTPHQYLLKIRIERAKEKLQSSSLPLSEIAYELGFTDQSHFSKHFKKITGMSPLKWKQNFIQK
ncbi:AraC family transcriptional regulator [Priestia megaterium]|nr:AraC family transcriptional regulator [Priestia megaterium]